MQVVLTCIDTWLHRGGKPSQNRRGSRTTSVVFIDFRPNIGYTYIGMSCLDLGPQICNRETLAFHDNVSLKDSGGK